MFLKFQSCINSLWCTCAEGVKSTHKNWIRKKRTNKTTKTNQIVGNIVNDRAENFQKIDHSAIRWSRWFAVMFAFVAEIPIELVWWTRACTQRNKKAEVAKMRLFTISASDSALIFFSLISLFKLITFNSAFCESVKLKYYIVLATDVCHFGLVSHLANST